MVDNPATIKSVGRALIIDGTKRHYSDQYEGTRYSIVAFQHVSTYKMGPDQLRKLVGTGFKLPPTLLLKTMVSSTQDDEEELNEVQVASGGHANAASRLALDIPKEACGRTLIEFCCEEDSVLGRVSPPDCNVIRLTEEHDLTQEATVQELLQSFQQGDYGQILLWASIPCTGGSQWNVFNLLKHPKEMAPRMEMHWALFRILWSSFVLSLIHI